MPAEAICLVVIGLLAKVSIRCVDFLVIATPLKISNYF